MKYLITTLLAFGFALHINAHALLIKTAPEGEIGREHSVEVLYEEFADGSVEEVEDWYSDVGDFTLWLINPKGEKTQLDCKESIDRYTTSFVPTIEGTYKLMVSHEAKDLGGTTKYQFNAQAIVLVSHKNIDANFDTELSIEVQSLKNKAKKDINIRSLFQGTPNSDVQVTVFSPSGWNKVFTPDSNGNIHFKPLWKGNYIIEATHYNGSESGTHHDKEYSSVWRCTTIQIPIQ
ncbi:hypothetical protein [Membranihabitans maritimus]|uniref:hypothetical protein n=1 Tax=Membranihabitans maritimus TaxID=2904244 RepID=UPI001F2333AB|nr:hypothetical protein [Membranihabitans maritimus]